MFETTLYLTLAIVFLIIPSIVTVTLNSLGVMLGGIPTGILYFLFIGIAVKCYKLYSVANTKRKNLKGYRRSEPDPNQLCFEYDGGYYPYLDFLFSQTLARIKLDQKNLNKEIQISFDLKNNDSLVEIEFYAASIAIALRKNKMNSYESVRMATKWVVENKNELDAASNPMDVCEKLSQQDFSPKHR